MKAFLRILALLALCHVGVAVAAMSSGTIRQVRLGEGCDFRQQVFSKTAQASAFTWEVAAHWLSALSFGLVAGGLWLSERAVARQHSRLPHDSR